MTTEAVCLKGRQHEFGPALELAPHVVYVGRAMYQGGWRLPASPFANPFRAQKVGGAGRAVEMYLGRLRTQAALLERALRELTGATLGCWCLRPPCHACALAEGLDSGLFAGWLAGAALWAALVPGTGGGEER